MLNQTCIPRINPNLEKGQFYTAHRFSYHISDPKSYHSPLVHSTPATRPPAGLQTPQVRSCLRTIALAVPLPGSPFSQTTTYLAASLPFLKSHLLNAAFLLTLPKIPIPLPPLILSSPFYSFIFLSLAFTTI